MRLAKASIISLGIPFVESFKHSTKERTFSDAVVLRVEDTAGNVGYGEGLPRPYVSGETVDSMIAYLETLLWPAVAGRELPAIASEADLAALDAFIPDFAQSEIVAPNAARAAMELAILDCALKAQGRSLGALLPPRRPKVTYSGVITSGSVEKAVQHARQMKLVGLRAIKIKVGLDDDVARVKAIREVVGPDASLRLDANGAWGTVDEAVSALEAFAPHAIASVEQPLPRGPVEAYRALKDRSPIPVMVDESLVTLADADALIAAGAVDYFNVRISKCGGIYRSLEMARRAHAAGIRLQVGSQVGETALLSAAGRHLAAHLEAVDFVEGSFGTLLLTEDISADPVKFAHKGEAAVLAGPGLGVRVLEEKLAKYARRTIACAAGAPA